MSRYRFACGALLVATTFSVLAFAQRGGQATLQITSPVEGSFISGSITIRAEVDPPTAVKSVVFFAEGRQLCTVNMPPFECSWDAGATIVKHQVRVVANLMGDQRVVRVVNTKGVGFAEKVDVDIVQVTATVLDGRGHYVRGLARTAFHISEDDQPQTITHFASEDVPLELIVAVDVSGSMTAAMPKMKQAVKEFLGTVPARDRVTLIGFNDSVFTLTRNTTNP